LLGCEIRTIHELTRTDTNRKSTTPKDDANANSQS
jgi:hypothetical protein